MKPNIKPFGTFVFSWMHFLIIALLLLVLPGVSYGQILVTPSNMGIWAFGTEDAAADGPGTGDIAQMVTGPGTPPLGVGSAELATAPGAGDSAAFISTDAYDGTKIASLTSLSYSTYVTANNGQQFPYLKLYVSTDGSDSPASINSLYFEPPYQTPTSGNSMLPNQGATTLATWQTWNALEGGWWDDNGDPGLNPGTGVGSLATFLALYPNATIVAGSFSGGLRLTAGFASPDDTFTTYVDNVTIGTASGTTTYDFEPGAVPEPSSWALLLELIAKVS
jgi:hypothetical protein